MRRFIVAYRWEIALVVGIPASSWGLWVLQLESPLDLYGLAYDLVWWNVVVLLPALLVGALYLRLRRRGYGWESLLLVATPYWAVLSGGAFTAVVYRFPSLTSQGRSSLALGLTDCGIPAQFVAVILLAALYPAIGRPGRDFLRLTWQFLLVVGIIGLVVDGLFLAMQLRGLAVGFGSTAWGPDLPGALLAGPLAMFLLLRFIRRTSRFSPAHALFMVALAFSFPWHHLFESSGGVMLETRLDYLLVAALNVAVRSLAIGMTVFTAWLLFNFDRWVPLFRRRAVAAVFGVHAINGVLFSLWLIQGFTLTSDVGVLLALAVGLMAWLVAFWAVYLVRIRHPNAPSALPGGEH